MISKVSGSETSHTKGFYPMLAWALFIGAVIIGSMGYMARDATKPQTPVSVKEARQ
jgi:hypothetical protein